MRDTLECESNFRIDAHNKTDPYGGAKGIAQFLQPTFDRYAPLAGIENGDPFNPEDAIRTMAYMFSIGEAKQWTCWRLIKSGKYIPRDSS